MRAFDKENIIQLFIPFVIAFFTPIINMIVLVGFLLMCDLFTGVWAAKKRGEKITSHKMKNTITKMIMYSLAIIIARSFEYVFFDSIDWQLPMASITGGYIAIVEIKSNFENLGYITGTDIWTLIKSKVVNFQSVNEDNKNQEL